MPKYIKKLAWWVWSLGLILAFLIGQQVGWNKAQIDWNDPPEWLQYPTIQQVQAWLGCEKIDGWLCDGLGTPDHSETRDKWTEKMGNQMLAKYFTESGAPEN